MNSPPKLPAIRYFGLEVGAYGKPVDDGSALCRSCRKQVIAKHGNTSNLLAHLQTNHPTLHTQAKAAMEGKGKQPARKATPAPPTSSQQTLQESMTVRVAYERKSAKWKELTDAVTYFIAKDSLPIFTVKKSGFKRLMRTFDPRYELPSCSYFSNSHSCFVRVSEGESEAGSSRGILLFCNN